MSGARQLLAQTFFNLRAHKLRSALTMFGIAWGIASIIFMMAIGESWWTAPIMPSRCMPVEAMR